MSERASRGREGRLRGCEARRRARLPLSPARGLHAAAFRCRMGTTWQLTRPKMAKEMLLMNCFRSDCPVLALAILRVCVQEGRRAGARR